MPSTYSRPAHSLAPFHLGPSTLSACVALDGSHIHQDARRSFLEDQYSLQVPSHHLEHVDLCASIQIFGRCRETKAPDRDVEGGMRGHELHRHRRTHSVRRYLGPVRLVSSTCRASGCRPSMEWLVQDILLPLPPRRSLSQYSCTASIASKHAPRAQYDHPSSAVQPAHEMLVVDPPRSGFYISQRVLVESRRIVCSGACTLNHTRGGSSRQHNRTSLSGDVWGNCSLGHELHRRPYPLIGIYGTTAQPARVLAFSRSQTTLRFRKAFVYLYNDESAARQHRLREYCAALASISSPSLSGSASGAFTDSVMGSK